LKKNRAEAIEANRCWIVTIVGTEVRTWNLVPRVYECPYVRWRIC